MMYQKFIVVFLCAACIATFGSWAFAEENEDEDEADFVAALAKTGITLAQAIEAGDKEVPGGKVVEAGLEVEDDKAVFEVGILTEKGVTEVLVDATTGKVLKAEAEEVEPEDAEEVEEAKRALTQVKVSPADAIKAAETDSKGGKAAEIELGMKKDKAIYEVGLVVDGKPMSAVVDAVSGKVEKIEAWKKEKEEAKSEKKEHEPKDK